MRYFSYRWLLWFLVLSLLAGAVLTSKLMFSQDEKRVSRTNFKKILKGMTEDQVEEILGSTASSSPYFWPGRWECKYFESIDGARIRVFFEFQFDKDGTIDSKKGGVVTNAIFTEGHLPVWRHVLNRIKHTLTRML